MVERDGGSGPPTELEHGGGAGGALDPALGTDKPTELDVSAAAAAALAAAGMSPDPTPAPIEPAGSAGHAIPASAAVDPGGSGCVDLLDDLDQPTVFGPPSDTGVAPPRRPRTSAFAPTAAVSELTADSLQHGALEELEELPEGTLLAGRYHIKELVGEGGMGAVYAAHDDDLDEDIALKVLRPDLARDASVQRRLKAEVRLARRVSHPNVCRVHDYGVDDELVFVTMELVRGRTLRERLAEIQIARAEPFELAQIVDIVVQLGSALSAAHRAGVIHRDVKPDNVILASGRAVLTDFGVASLVIDRARAIVGTPAYLAPEVLRGEGSDHRVDIYAVAALAYELITGAPPFNAHTIDLALELARQPPPYPALPIAFGTSAVRTALDRVLARGLAADPLMRAATIDRFADAFAHAARGAPTSTSLRARVFEGPGARDVVTPVPLVRRTELRVATAFAWYGNRSARDTEAAEHIVVDAGGAPIRVEAGELVALFGTSRSTSDDADRAAHAALDVIAKFGGRAGLDTTRILLRATDTDLAGPDSAATATALAHVALEGQVWVSQATARQLAARFEIAMTKTDARRVTRVREASIERAVDSLRAREVAEISEHLERAFRERTPVFVEVRGTTGSGKTRVRKAVIAAIAERRDVDWLVAAASPIGDAAPLSIVQSCSAEWFEATTGSGSIVDPAARAVAARTWLETRALHRPVVVVVEDLQWTDPSSRALLDQLRVSLEGVPVAIVTFVRGERTDAPANVTSVWLAPLERDRATALARELAPDAASDDIAAVVERAAGNPFFIEELSRELASGAARAALPTSVEAVVQTHLDQLSELAAQVAICAAVIGHGFWRKAVLHVVAGLGEAALDEALGELERAGVIARVAPKVLDDDYYAFQSSLVREVAYSRLPARERRYMHVAIANWIDEQRHAPEQLAAWLLAIAHHREHGGESPRAALAYRQAGTHCLEQFAYGEAALALRKAAALTSIPDPVLDEALGDAVAHTEGYAAAEPIFQRALDETDDEDAAARARLWCKLGSAASRRGTTATAIARFNAGLAIVAPGGRLASWAVGDPRTAAQLWAGLGWTLGYQLGRVEEGHPYCERAVAVLEPTPYRRELALALSRLGGTYMRMCRFADQLRCIQRNLELAIELRDPQMQLTANINLGVVHGVLGDLERAVAVTLTARELAARMDSISSAGLVASNLAGFYLDQGRLDEADRLLDEAIAIGERTGSRYYMCESLVYRARVASARGDLANARIHAESSLALSRSLGNPLHGAIALRILASLDSLGGDHEGARKRIEAALVQAVIHDEFEAIRTRAARARILANAGDPTASGEMADLRYELTRLGAQHELAVLERVDEVR